jgi:hypothetical protein
MRREILTYENTINNLKCQSEFRRGIIEGQAVIIAMRDAEIAHLREELAATQDAANNSSVENIVLKKRLFQAEGGHQ